jgi:hypothetical protein
VKKANIETFVITKSNRAHRAPFNQKLSSFNISSATGYPHVLFVGSVTPIHPQLIQKLYIDWTQLQRWPSVYPGPLKQGNRDRQFVLATRKAAMLTHWIVPNWHLSITLTEVFPYFFLSSKTNARVQNTKTRHGPHSPHIRWLNFLRD